ncbi:TPA: hypothetical protein QIC81_005010 [Escherichia coli]|nr:hypothetical protein [Escherichia coli]
MLFYEHSLYKRKKIIRDKIKKYFPVSHDENFKPLAKKKSPSSDFINSCIIDFIESCKESSSYSGIAKDVLYKNRITDKENLKENSFYFMTSTEIKKYLKDSDYKIIIEKAMMVSIYETAAHYGYYHLVLINRVG